MSASIATQPRLTPRLPPRWFIRAAWAIHRALYRVTRGKVGVWPPKPGGWGALRLTTTGRHTGEPRSVILGYFEDETSFVVAAMNGWGAAEPAWSLNLQANPSATIATRDWRGPVTGVAATGEQRDRLWARWKEIEPALDEFAALRSGVTELIVFEPQDVAK